MPLDVIDHDAPAIPVPSGQESKTTKEETVTIPKSQWESTQRERDESRESERYWAGLARNGNTSRAAESVEETDEDDARQFLDSEAADGIEGDTPEKLVDEFASKGVAALKSRGFITAADAQKLAVETALKVSREMIGRERQKMSSDNTLMTDFPELKDKNSELFKETAKIYQQAVAMDPNAKKTPAALYLAAKAAKAGLRRTTLTRDERDDDSYGPHSSGYREDEDDRRRRSDSQDGRTRGRGDMDDRDDLLGDEAKQVIKAMGISEEEFKQSQKQTAGAGRGRRR